ncbi:MAG: glycosyltransferase family 4 protein [Kiritimatiellae bacterium]|nr:glycosyltransferase family 4 protein [Kiritimatiellia bacterium]
MKIMFLCPKFAVGGGGQTYTMRLGEELARLGHDVTICSEGLPEKNPNDVSGVHWQKLKVSRWHQRISRWLGNIKDLRGGERLIRCLFPQGDFSVFARTPLCPELKNPAFFDDVDVVVVIMSAMFAWSRVVGKTLRGRGKKVVFVPFFHVRMDMYDWPCQRKIHELADCVVTLTGFEKRFLEGKGWDGNRIRVAGVGSDETGPAKMSPSEFRQLHGIPEGVPVVMFLGRKNYHKGAAHVVMAMETVWGAFPEARLVLVGFSQNSKSWLAGYLSQSKYGGPDKTVDIDDATADEREAALETASVMALPSVNDAFGIAYLDAWRHKVPVVGCSDTCCEDVVSDGVDGLLVPFGDVDALGQALVRMLSDDATRRTMGENGCEKWKREFSWATIARKWDVFLQEQAAAKMIMNETSEKRAGECPFGSTNLTQLGINGRCR